MSAHISSNASASQPFRCHFADCQRVFKRRDRLDIHLRVHTGERPFVCEVEGCRKSYSRSQHLSRHVQNVHKLLASKPETFSCPVCRMELANTYCLQNHLKAEHEEKIGPKRYPVCMVHILSLLFKIMCPHEGCGKTFNWLNLLKRHMKVHEGYPCSKQGCDKVFPNWSSLRKHVAQDHAQVYSCDECGIKFSRKPNLNQHIKRKHQGPKLTYACTIEGCGRTYDYESNLALHIREFHNGESIWKNRARKRTEKKPKKTAKKISFAAKLCGLDDRGEELTFLKKRRKLASKKGDFGNTFSSCGDEQQEVDASVDKQTIVVQNSCARVEEETSIVEEYDTGLATGQQDEPELEVTAQEATQDSLLISEGSDLLAQAMELELETRTVSAENVADFRYSISRHRSVAKERAVIR
ncbi:transcription factor IIIA-like protein [Elysia marginata]|uniref:Transcription factor IIIA-like protein n=1 Tax=Elysia marginata TaxID=1093978 RepID=A0AAV4HLF0_9GAST|nr:transcription factor IIIA-like protein [Elysia marginata]